MSNAPFKIDPVLTAIAIAYRNRRMIADEVLPRVPVGKQEFKWRLYDLGQGFNVPETTVGRTSKPNQVEFSSTEETASTVDHALDSPVPNVDLENAPPGYDPIHNATEQTSNLIVLDREVRVARLVFNTNSYAADNQITLAGASQWSDPASDPLAQITDSLDGMIMRANIGILGRRTATILRRHPKVVKAFNGSMGDEGMVPLEFLKDFLELEEIKIGEANISISKPGQPVKLNRVWGNHAAFIYRDTLANTQSGTTFGATAQFGNRVSGSIIDSDMGMRGGQRVRVGESVKELVFAKDLGFFFENAVADI